MYALFRKWFGHAPGDDPWKVALQSAALPAPAEADRTRRVLLAPLIQRVLKAGYHRTALAPDGEQRGMNAQAYAQLWPASVRITEEELPWVSHAVLVDTTIAPRLLSKYIEFDERSARPEQYRDLVPPPVGANGAPLKRYIALFQNGCGGVPGALTASAQEFRDKLPNWVAPLNGIEAAHIAIQHPEIFKRSMRGAGTYKMRVPGTSCGTNTAIYLGARDGKIVIRAGADTSCGNRPGKDVEDYCGNASRLAAVIEVP